MRPGTYQASCNSGELSPELHGNTGLKQFYSGLAAAANVMPVPQGGFDLLPRTRYHYDFGVPTGEYQAFSFTVSTTEARSYIVVVTAASIFIFWRGTLVGTVGSPYAIADIATVKAIQRQDTMILWHRNYAPRRLLRLSHTSWSLSAVAWVSIPDVDYGGTYTNVDEKWIARLQWTSGATVVGADFTLSVDGAATTMVSIAGTGSTPDWPATATAVAAVLSALPGIDAGLVVTSSSTGSLFAEFEVVFSGGRNSGGNFVLSGEFINTINFALTTARTRKGDVGGEPVMSASRGYPRCAAWFQDRLLMGGFLSKSSAWLASRTAEYFDLNTELNADTGAMLVNLDTDGGEAILHFLQGPYLGIFTDRGEYHLSDRALKRNTPPNIVRSSTNGISERCPPILQEGSILYVAREESIVYSATYDAVSTTFVSAPLSLMSSHLIRGIRGAALQVSHSATDAQRYYLPRDDGVLVIAGLIRGQEVQPFVRWTTDGVVKAVAVDGDNTPYLLVDRQVDGETHRYFESLEDGLLFDASLTLTDTTTTISGLDIHEGREVWADLDGWIEGPFIVSGGAITVSTAAATATVGRWTPPFVKTLPLPRDIGGRQVLKRPARVHTVQADLIDTTSIAIGANGGAPQPVNLARFGDPLDTPTPARTGPVVVTGLRGFSDEGQVVITQLRPGRLQVRDWTIQART